ncbi:MAG: DNA primase [Candidatus Diapherotrites archaeon]|nr:DNA primase [Candidatus Diapherotrites archaeon]
MAKTYIGAAKYLIKIRFKISGIVDHEDIIGAVFGQSEGLLGDEMDLKELQRSGKIGRIEVRPQQTEGTTTGDLELPSSMDMAQTSLLAAAIETVDKVGPCEAKFEIIELQDTRSKKKDLIKNRAQELLSRLMTDTASETHTLTDTLREGARASKIASYGPDQIPAGPDIENAPEIVIVEGRADVLNLLKNQIDNCIAMNGSKVTQSLIDLCFRKQTVLFVDGDRGGELNARKISALTKIDYVARAPDGKEVEEITRKEMLQCLSKKVPLKEFLEKAGVSETPFDRRPLREGMGRDEHGRGPPRGRGREMGPPHGERRPLSRGMGRNRPDDRGFGRGPPRERMDRFDRAPRMPPAEMEPREPEIRPTPQETEQFTAPLASLKGQMKAKAFDAQMKEVGETNVNTLYDSLDQFKGAHAVVLDGIITKRLYDKAQTNGISYLIGVRKGKLGTGNVRALTL